MHLYHPSLINTSAHCLLPFSSGLVSWRHELLLFSPAVSVNQVSGVSIDGSESPCFCIHLQQKLYVKFWNFVAISDCKSVKGLINFLELSSFNSYTVSIWHIMYHTSFSISTLESAGI